MSETYEIVVTGFLNLHEAAKVYSALDVLLEYPLTIRKVNPDARPE